MSEKQPAKADNCVIIDTFTGMIKHYNIIVKGRVQGVGFRYATQREARLWGIRGFVKNLPDGSVYIEAEGEQEILQQFARWCHEGPSQARVEDIEVSEAPATGAGPFSVRY